MFPEFVEDGLGSDGSGESFEAREDETEFDVFVGGREVGHEHDGEETIADEDLLVVGSGGSDDGDVLVSVVDPFEKLGRGERSRHDATDELGEVGWSCSSETSLKGRRGEERKTLLVKEGMRRRSEGEKTRTEL